MLNQFVKALILVIITAVSTYAFLTLLPLEEKEQTSQTAVKTSESTENAVKQIEQSSVPKSEKVVAETANKAIEQSQLANTDKIEQPPLDTNIQPNSPKSHSKTINNEHEENIVLNKGVETTTLPNHQEQHKQGSDLTQEKTKLAEFKPVDQASSDEVTNSAETQQQEAVVQDFNSSTLKHLIPLQTDQENVEAFCQELANKLRTVKYQGCLDLNLGVEAHYRSVENRSLTYRHFVPKNFSESQFNANKEQSGRILFISGIHGDEYSAISITYLWMLNMLHHKEKNTQHWLFLPLTNPDGLFKNPATRMNANKVDLNRNFPSPDWDELALDYWVKYYKRNKRRYPGPSASSEPETQWLVELIEEFKPDAIISVHAPYGLVDYDGPEHAIPNRIGALKHRELGTYPGSLGRYAGEYMQIPVLTLELRAAGSMPSDDEIYTMWRDIEEWTITKIRGGNPGPIPKLKRVQ